MVEDIEELATKLCRKFFVELLSFAHRHIQVPKAWTVEQTSRHCPEGADRCGCNCGATLCPTAGSGESGERAGMRRARLSVGGQVRRRIGCPRLRVVSRS